MVPPKSNRSRVGSVAVAVIAVCVLTPFVTSVLQVGGAWMPVGDTAIIVTRARDVFTRDTPLLGQPSTAGERVGTQVHHPGPLEFWAIAGGQKLVDHPMTGLIVVTAVNAMAAMTVLWWLRRLGGLQVLALASPLVVWLLWSMRGDILVDPLNPFAALVPFTGYVISLVAAASGKRWAPASAVVLGSYAAQAHLTMTGLVGTAAAVTIAWCLGRWLLGRRRPAAACRGARTSPRAPVLVALALLLACWAGPIVEAVMHGGGNVVALASTGAALDTQTLGASGAVDRTVQGLDLRSAWSGRALDTRVLGAPPTRPQQVAVVALWVIGAGAALACRKRTPAVGLAFVISTAVVATGTLLMTRMPDSFFNTIAIGNYVWLRPAAALLWGATLAGLVAAPAPFVRGRVRRLLPLAATGTAAAVALACVVSAPRRPLGQQVEAAYTRALSGQLGARLVPGDSYVMDVARSLTENEVAHGVLHELVRRGFDVRVDGFAESFGEMRSRPAEAGDGTLVIQRGSTRPEPPDPDAILLAEHVPSPRALDERRRAEERLTERITRAGGPTKVVPIPGLVDAAVTSQELARDGYLGLVEVGLVEPEAAAWPETTALLRVRATPVDFVTVHLVAQRRPSPVDVGDRASAGTK